MEFTIKLAPEHVNTIFAGLDELPHKAARRVIDHVLQQVQQQEAAARAAQAPEDTQSAGLSD
jgi:hypothetical protein